MAQGKTALKRVLSPLQLWSIAVGLVISGEYFGWNLGWGVAGSIGFLISTLIITLLYISFIFSYTELTTSIPHAGGAYAYAYRAMGPIAGLIAGYSALIDFLFATPAIAFALGAYLNFLYPALPVLGSALVFNSIFIGLNILGIKESANFSVLITLLSVAELLLFMGLVIPHFKMSTYMNHPMPFGWKGVFAGLPYAVWFFLAIEGVAMVAEEVKNPRRNISRGYIYGLGTLIFLAFGVMILSGGVTDWRNLSSTSDPLPETIRYALGKGSYLTTLFAGLGLFGLIASLHGTILASSRQVFAMARGGYFPGFLSRISPKLKTPYWAIIAGGIVSFIALFTGTTNQVVVISVMGAVLMYMVSMISLFILRVKEPDLERPFSSPFYPWLPAVALFLSSLTLFAVIYFNLILSLYFFLGLGLSILLYFLMGKHKNPIQDVSLLENAYEWVKS